MPRLTGRRRERALAWNCFQARARNTSGATSTAFEMLGGGTLIPVHWGTFDRALHAWDEPAETLLSLAEVRRARIAIPELGRAFVPDRLTVPTPWWRDVGRALRPPVAATPIRSPSIERNF